MSGLVLKLAPKERVLINGAVIENGEKRSRLSVMTPNANILRLRDAIHPDEVNTPVRRVCYIAQLVLSGDAMASPEAAIRALPHETLIVHGREDKVIPLQNSLTLGQWIPNSQLHVFGHCGHWTQIEHAARFAQLVANFLAEADAQADAQSAKQV